MLCPLTNHFTMTKGKSSGAKTLTNYLQCESCREESKANDDERSLRNPFYRRLETSFPRKVVVERSLFG